MPKINTRQLRVWHIFHFKERYELDSYDRKNGLEFTREFVTAGGSKSNEASQYTQQLDELRALTEDRYYEVHGIFVALRSLTAPLERVYRGYLLDSRLGPMAEKTLARRLHLDAKRLRYALTSLAEVDLIERVPLPDFEALMADEQEEKISEHSETVSSPSKEKKNGNGKGIKGKEKTNGKGKGNQRPKRQGNGQVKGKAKGQAQDNSKAEPKCQAETALAPATAPPNLPTVPTEADARGASRSYQTERPPGSDTPPATVTGRHEAEGFARTELARNRAGRSDLIATELKAIERQLLGFDPEPEESRYSARAEAFAAEIYLAMDLGYGRNQAARERGTLASCWTRAEAAGLPPPMLDRLWDHAIVAARKLRKKKRRLRNAGSMFSEIWKRLLAKAQAGSLA